MSDPASPAAHYAGNLPWPAGWARRTHGPLYRPATIGAILCLLLAGALAIRNLADGFLVVILALGILAFALRPAHTHPVRVTLGEAFPGSGVSGARFPLRITNLFTARHRPCVTLTPAAVVASAGDPLVIPWSQITEVRATTAVTGVPHPLLPPPRQNWLLIGVADRQALAGTPERELRRFGEDVVLGFPVTRLLTDPVVLFHTLHYYLDNPAARPELAHGAAVSRIRARRVQPHDS